MQWRGRPCRGTWRCTTARTCTWRSSVGRPVPGMPGCNDQRSAVPVCDVCLLARVFHGRNHLPSKASIILRALVIHGNVDNLHRVSRICKQFVAVHTSKHTPMSGSSHSGPAWHVSWKPSCRLGQNDVTSPPALLASITGSWVSDVTPVALLGACIELRSCWPRAGAAEQACCWRAHWGRMTADQSSAPTRQCRQPYETSRPHQ